MAKFEITTIRKTNQNDSHSLKINKNEKIAILDELTELGFFKKWISKTDANDVRYYFQTLEFAKNCGQVIPPEISSYFNWQQSGRGNYYVPSMFFNSKSNVLIVKFSYGYDHGDNTMWLQNRYTLLCFMKDVFEKAALKAAFDKKLDDKPVERKVIRKI